MRRIHVSVQTKRPRGGAPARRTQDSLPCLTAASPREPNFHLVEMVRDEILGSLAGVRDDFRLVVEALPLAFLEVAFRLRGAGVLCPDDLTN